MKNLIFLVFVFFKINSFAQVQQLTPGMQFVLNGDQQMKALNWNQAYLEYSTAISVDPNSAEAFYKRSIALTKLARFAEAIEDQNRAQQLKPGIANLYDSRAQLKLLVEDIPGAIEDFTKAIESDPTEPELYNQLAHAHMANGEFALAVEDYNKMIQLDPNDTLAYVFRRSLTLI